MGLPDPLIALPYTCILRFFIFVSFFFFLFSFVFQNFSIKNSNFNWPGLGPDGSGRPDGSASPGQLKFWNFQKIFKKFSFPKTAVRRPSNSRPPASRRPSDLAMYPLSYVLGGAVITLNPQWVSHWRPPLFVSMWAAEKLSTSDSTPNYISKIRIKCCRRSAVTGTEFFRRSHGHK